MQKNSAKNQCGPLYSLPAKSQFSSFPACQAIPTLCRLAGLATSSPRKQSLSCVSCHATPLHTACDGSMQVTRRRPGRPKGKSEGELLGKQTRVKQRDKLEKESKTQTNKNFTRFPKSPSCSPPSCLGGWWVNTSCLKPKQPYAP